MVDVVLHCPEIPPNTGNVIRLAANAGVRLHLVRPLGFSMEDRQLRRAGLDYHEYAEIVCHDNWDACAAAFAGRRMFALTTRGGASYASIRYAAGDVLVFGSETRGLPPEILDRFPAARRLRIPMRAGSRSLNLSNAVAIAVYEVWRQLEFRAGI